MVYNLLEVLQNGLILNLCPMYIIIELVCEEELSAANIFVHTHLANPPQLVFGIILAK